MNRTVVLLSGSALFAVLLLLAALTRSGDDAPASAIEGEPPRAGVRAADAPPRELGARTPGAPEASFAPAAAAPEPEVERAPRGYAHFVKGRVLDERGQGLGGALVLLRAVLHSRPAVMYAATSGADGTFKMPTRFTEHPTPREYQYGPPNELVVDVRALGFRDKSVSIPNPWAARDDLAVTIQLDPGGTARGRVVYEEKPVPGTSVFLLGTDFKQLDETRTDDEGRYGLPFTGRGRYTVHARRDSVGVATVLDVELHPLLDVELPDLVLAGEGRITGTVVDPNGRAVPGIELEVIPESHAYGRDASIPFTRLIEAELQGGLYHTVARADMQGDFAVEGLLAGSYTLRFPGLASEDLQPVDFYTTPALGVRVVYHGAVLLVGTEARGLRRGAAVTTSCSRITYRDGVEKLVEERRASGEGAHSFVVEPGQRYLLRAWSPGAVEDVDVVELSAGRTWTTARLVVLGQDRDRSPRRTVGAGAVKLEVRTEDGERVKGFEVGLRNLETGAFARGFSRAEAPRGRLEPVMPGEYELVLFSTRKTPELDVRTVHEEPVAVSARKTTEVTVTVPTPGRLRIVIEEDEDMPANPGPDELSRFGFRLRLERLHAFGDQDLPAGFLPSGAAGLTDGVLLLPGGAATLVPRLAPGPYSVFLWRKDADPIWRRAEIRPGEVTEVSIRPPRR